MQYNQATLSASCLCSDTSTKRANSSPLATHVSACSRHLSQVYTLASCVMSVAIVPHCIPVYKPRSSSSSQRHACHSAGGVSRGCGTATVPAIDRTSSPRSATIGARARRAPSRSGLRQACAYITEPIAHQHSHEAAQVTLHSRTG